VLLTPPLFNPNFWGVPVAPDRPCWASTSAWSLSYLAVKLFSKNSNLVPCHWLEECMELSFCVAYRMSSVEYLYTVSGK